MISCLYAIEWRCMWTQISFSLHFHPQLELKKCGKIQATVKKPLLNRFRDLIVEGQVYRMAYFTVVSNHGSYRATSHEFKLVFLHRTTVVAVDEDVIPKTCFNMFPFSDLLNMTEDYDFLVDIIGLLTSVGEEKKYAKEGKIVKMIVLELTSKDLTLRCALFGDYVNQVNHFLASGYVEQPVVVIQLAKVKFFRGQVGLQNVMYATQMLFNPDLPEVVDFRHSMIEQGVNGTQPLFIANEGKVVSLEDDFMRLTRKCTIEELQDKNQEGSFIIFGTIQGIVEDGGWWYSACVCGKGIYPQNGVYYCDFSLKHITNVTPRFKVKITVEDHSGEGIFLLFDREASYLLKKSCADLFSEVQRDASGSLERSYCLRLIPKVSHMIHFMALSELGEYVMIPPLLPYLNFPIMMLMTSLLQKRSLIYTNLSCLEKGILVLRRSHQRLVSKVKKLMGLSFLR
nr:replication protein A 70 kDa DNA-binding subunit C isoform X5 [Arachis hypogaea]